MTDGAPHDVDVHDQQYLVLDARRAVQEQRRHRIASFCVSPAEDSDDHVKTIFGQRHYSVLGDIRCLPARLLSVYSRLIRG